MPFLDTNLYYDEIGIKFDEDFMDSHHTNLLGANKFTEFFASYLVENYNLRDRRGDPQYADWDVPYEAYQTSAEQDQNKIAEQIETRNQAMANIDSMKKIRRFYAMAGNGR